MTDIIDILYRQEEEMMRIDLSKTAESSCVRHIHHDTRTEPKAPRPDPTQEQKLLRVGEDLSEV